MRSRYFRIKILTDAGKELGDVQIMFDRRSDGRGYTVDEIAGRTIEPDGTIIPFTGKPYEKTLHKDKENQITAKVFSMPSVRVGSILEYRYKLRWDDNLFSSPDWDIQTGFYLVKGHFLWRPTDKELLRTTRGGRQSTTSALVWNKSLPPGTDVNVTHLPSGRNLLEVNVSNIRPFLTEDYMPPIQSSAYHVFFYYTPYRSGPEFWKTEGKYWSSDANSFMGNSSTVRNAATEAAGGAASDEGKAKAIYALTSRLENMSYTRNRSQSEDKAAGLKEIKSAEDVLKRKRGSRYQIAMTYVALARAAGLNASLMAVIDRSERVFDASWFEFGQLGDDIVIVNYNGADHYLDPGTPCVPFGHLDWTHSASGGIRQQDKETTLLIAPAESYKYSRTTRTAMLTLQDGGSVTGTLNLTYQGSPAVAWRQMALRTDESELRHELQKQIEQMLPGGSVVDIKSVEDLTSAEAPLKVTAKITSPMSTVAGSRVVLPSDIFVATRGTQFPHEHRDQAVYFPYAETLQDAMRLTLPAGYAIESAPPAEQLQYKQAIAYSQKSKQDGSSVTIWRDLLIGEFYFPLEDYPQLRSFYSSFERKDHTSVVLKQVTNESAEVQPSHKK